MRRRVVAGNWKLHGTRAFATGLVAEIAAMPVPGVELVILPPLPYIGDLIEDFEVTPLAFGAQDVSSNEQGAYTGEVSASMLVDVGARYGLVGHSERRQYHAESSQLVALKFQAAIHAGLRPILCRGESLEQREAGQTEAGIALPQGYLSAYTSLDRFNALYQAVLESEGAPQAHDFVREELKRNPTLMGLDSDHPASRGEVGKCGVAIDSLKEGTVASSRYLPLDFSQRKMPPLAPAKLPGITNQMFPERSGQTLYRPRLLKNAAHGAGSNCPVFRLNH